MENSIFENYSTHAPLKVSSLEVNAILHMHILYLNTHYCSTLMAQPLFLMVFPYSPDLPFYSAKWFFLVLYLSDTAINRSCNSKQKVLPGTFAPFHFVYTVSLSCYLNLSWPLTFLYWAAAVRGGRGGWNVTNYKKNMTMIIAPEGQRVVHDDNRYDRVIRMANGTNLSELSVIRNLC